MKKLITTFIFATIVFSAMAQSVKISGTVRDDSNQPVEYATVALNDPATNKPVDGAICDEKGKFTIKNVSSGTYNLTISFIGYESINVPLTVTNQNIDLNDLQLKSEDKILNEVVVEGQKALIEEKVDRTIYNAENDKTTSGGDATDVLQRVPHLTVDLDGNVSLRGSSNIKIFINNKPSMMAASSVADALKQIPADQIKSVEVITSPSSRYDAEGTSGIINIITKKNNLDGLSLNVDGSAGLRGSNLSVNGGYRKGKLGLNLGGFGRAGYNVVGSFNSVQENFLMNNTVMQGADTRNNNLNGRYTLGFDYDINKKNYITGSVMYGLRNQNNTQNNLLTEYYSGGIFDPSKTELANVETIDKSGTVDVNFNYTHLYDKPQQELSFLMLYSKNNRTNDFERFNLDPTDEDILTKIKNDNTSSNQETAFEVNYQSPIGENQLIEFGGKQTMRSVSSDYQYFESVGNGPYIPETSSNLSNIFDYNQDITAGYLSYTVNFNKKYFLKAGGRYEYTVIDAAFAQEVSPTEIPDYGTFVPSINVSTNLKNGSTIKAAYNKRIQRPSIQYLNPNIQGANPLNITMGNPDLEPEFTDNYELSVSKYIKSTSINLTGFVRHTYNSIQSLRNPLNESDTILTTYQNIGTEDAYGLSLFTNVNVKDRLTLSGGIDTYYAVLDNNTNNDFAAHNEGWVVSGRLFGGYKFDNGWALQLFSFYRGNRVQLQGSQGGFGIYSLTVRKEIFDKKGSIGLGAENFFNFNGMKIKSETITPTFQQNSVNTMQNMNVKVSFSFRLGKMGVDSNPRRNRRSISNDDLKDGGGADMGGSETPSMGGSRPAGNFRGAATTAPVTLAAKNDSVTLDASGNWEYVMESPQGPSTGLLAITQTDGQYAGTISSNRMPNPIALTDVKVSGNEMTASYSMNFGGNEVTINIIGMITEDSMEGSMAFGTFRTMPFKATRKTE